METQMFIGDSLVQLVVQIIYKDLDLTMIYQTQQYVKMILS